MEYSPKAHNPDEILILGVGNLLMGDDGVGIHVAGALVEMDLPPGVRVEDGGMGGVSLLNLWEDVENVILIDAADMGMPPGTCVAFSPEEVRSVKEDLRLSLHHADVLSLLTLMKTLAMKAPTIRVVGVQPERIGWLERLSEPLQRSMPAILALVKAELARLRERQVTTPCMK